MDIWGAGFVATGMILYVVAHGWRARQEARHDVNRYRLFAVRDRLILEVAAGNLCENDKLFQLFYQRVNLSIGYTRQMNRRSLLEAVSKAFDPSDRELREAEARLLKDAPSPVQEACLFLYASMLDIFKSNSTTLRWLMDGRHWSMRLVGVVSNWPLVYRHVISQSQRETAAHLRDTSQKLRERSSPDGALVPA